MKVAHFGHFAPHQAGICQTALDMILAERAVGIDSQYIDYAGNKKPCRVGLKHGEIVTVGPSWADSADILVRHSAIPPIIEKKGKPIIMCMHGRPEYTFLLEMSKQSAVLSEYLKCAEKPNYKGFITFWKEHVPFLEFLLAGRQIDYVPAMVDLDRYNPAGSKFDFKEHRGSPNIVIADMFRADSTPFNVLAGAAYFVKKYCPTAKVHIFGLQGQDKNPVKAVLDSYKKAGVLGVNVGLVKNMDTVYRAADILVTPHIIATRVIREALASGLPVVGGIGCPYTQFQANACDTEALAAEIKRCWDYTKLNIPKTLSRQTAENNFGVKTAGEHLLPIYERVLRETKASPTVISSNKKPMIYNFVAYAPSDCDKDLGGTYNKYMELLQDDDWACFIDHDAMFTTPDWYKQVENIIAANPEYGLLTAVTNRIGNPQQKIAKLDDTHDILYHREVGTRAKLGGTTVMDVTTTHCISGVVMIVKKSVWKTAGGFQSGFLGVDNDFHKRVAKAGHKIGVCRGLYVYHYYRADGKSELKPVMAG